VHRSGSCSCDSRRDDAGEGAAGGIGGQGVTPREFLACFLKTLEPPVFTFQVMLQHLEETNVAIGDL
jgi:hypothetical protein